MDSKEQLLIKALLTSSGQINAVVIGGAILCCTVVGLRLVGKNEITMWNVPLKLSYFPVIAIGITLAHAYCAALQKLRVEQLLSSNRLVRELAWNELTTTGPLIFQGMERRLLAQSFRLPIIGMVDVYEMALSDYTMLLSLAMVTALIAALIASNINVPFKLRLSQINILAAAILIAFANWLIGSWWAIQTSRISVS